MQAKDVKRVLADNQRALRVLRAGAGYPAAELVNNPMYCAAKQIADTVEASLRQLSKREQAVIQLQSCDATTIAQQFHLSRGYYFELKRQALLKLGGCFEHKKELEYL
ncbi:hypothetical protein [Secundilactobacillus silagei]|uniref:Uncharacterized protein n=1 Tax=Secundilactobacillus silagei JCM 19001 TaxID=1302250 RepID=A0A1Z5IH45_9LACO|nr:hypothetical protein [Secundilactobacillus silagei]TDG69293.1 hypothetical protein C5L25_000224 [Secundilactobacillus silagei JCM 19001]GAX01016.1 hypothetical protein IWT126_01039 [Secundilactobacillus silagei JCM 19001]